MSLREQMRDYFSLTELQTVTFDLDIDFEELPPGGKSEKIQGLLELVERSGRVAQLIALLREIRGDLTWPDHARPLTRSDLWGQPERTPLPFEPDFVFVSAGPFLMGSPAGEGHPPHESPQHSVTLPGFYIGRLPITNSQYAAYIKQTKKPPPPKVGWFGPTPPKNKDHHPVVGVSWHDAQGYCTWLSGLTGRHMRLPTEAEWEKAARGTDGRRYPWGDAWEPERCNVNADNLLSAEAFPAGASPFGCLDMVGNAAEWTSTLWGDNWLESGFPYPYNPLDGRESSTAEPAFRIFRGTTLGQESEAERLRCAARSWYAPDNRDKRRGFRVVMEP